MPKIEAIAAALDIAIDHLTSAEKIEDEPTMEDCAVIFAAALSAAGFKIEAG